MLRGTVNLQRCVRLCARRIRCRILIGNSKQNGFAILQWALLALCTVAGLATAAPTTITAKITLVVGEGALITGVDDLLVGVLTADGNVSGVERARDRMCVFTSTGAYTLTVTSQNGGSQLQLVNSSGDTLRYLIRMRYRQGSLRGNTGNLSTPVIVQNNWASSTEFDCSDVTNWGGNNLEMRATVRASWLSAAPVGIYQDVVTLMVAPE